MTCRSSARLLAIFGLFVVAAVFAGCEVSIGGGGKTIDQSSEVDQARKTLGSLSDLPPTKSIDCPSGVDAKVDVTYQCTATLNNGQKVVLPARVASVGDQHDARLVSNLDVVQQVVAFDLIYRTADTMPASIQCPTDAPASVGQTIDCRVTFPNGHADVVTLKVAATTPRQNLKIAHIAKA